MSKKLKDALQFSVPVKFDKDQWLALLEILEFAFLTYAGVAEQTKADGEIKTAQHAAIMCKTSKDLMEAVQDSAINALYSSDTNH